LVVGFLVMVRMFEATAKVFELDSGDLNLPTTNGQRRFS
jgi:hypothetical protein